MTTIETLALQPAVAIGRALARGEASAVALTEHLLRQIAAQTSPVFLAVTGDRALSEARAADGRIAAGRPVSPLDGVPIAWKDLIDMAGERTTAGSELFRGAALATVDAPIVANAAAAGMVSLGKLNLSEFAYSGLGLNPHYGTPVNPHDAGTPRAPGGSSSGSAVAVAAGLVPCAIGTDTGGSVRIPASFNGLVGYKSSEGRIDRKGVFALSPTLDSVGPLARSVEDCVYLDRVLRGVAPAQVPARSLAELTIFVPEGIVMSDLEPAVAANFEASLRRLEAAGATLKRGVAEPLEEAVRLVGELGSITAAEAYGEHRHRVDGSEGERIDRRVLARIMAGARMAPSALQALRRARADGMARLAALLEGALLAMPTTALVAPPIAALEADDAVFHTANLKALRNTAIGNFLNLPGLAIPNGTDEGGMPTSFLLSATGGGDEQLFGFGLAAEVAIRGPA